MSAEAMTYEGAVERLEEIIRRLDSNQAGLRETLELCQEGKGLIEFAAGELDAVGQGLQELKLDDLIARLEAAPALSPERRGSGPTARPRPGDAWPSFPFSLHCSSDPALAPTAAARDSALFRPPPGVP